MFQPLQRLRFSGVSSVVGEFRRSTPIYCERSRQTQSSKIKGVLRRPTHFAGSSPLRLVFARHGPRLLSCWGTASKGGTRDDG
jgi:hypothetical protein